MLEWFVGGADYSGVMAFAEELVADVVSSVLGYDQGRARRRDDRLRDSVEADLRCATRCSRRPASTSSRPSRDELAELAGEDAEPDDDWAGAGRHPAGQAGRAEADPADLHRSTCRLTSGRWSSPIRDHPKLLGEAFDGIVAGMEIVGGGTDINDPIEQRRRFVEQRERQETGAEESPHPHDEEFVRALEYGMLPASGCGLGVDRLMMILTGSKTLRDVILFPTMRESAERLSAPQKAAECRRPPSIGITVPVM